jgi:hypothetical protein
MAVQNFGSGGGGYQVSPGINISEIDLTTVVPPTSTTVGAIAGVFRWGPVGVRTLVTSENDLVRKFGKPSSVNPETFFTAASFLGYSNALYVSRAANTSTVFAAIANTGAGATASATNTVKNRDDYDSKAAFNGDLEYIAKCPGALGNSLKISVCDSANAYTNTIDLQSNTVGDGNTQFQNSLLTINVSSNTARLRIANTNAVGVTNTQAQTFATSVSALFTVGDFIEVGNTSIGKQSLKITAITTANAASAAVEGTCDITLSLADPLKLSTNISSNTVARYWEYFNQVDQAPGTSTFQSQTATGNTSARDELHVVVVDEDGEFTGAPGSVLEVYKGMSRATDAKNSDGSTNYYKNVLNEQSQYVWWASDRTNAASANAASLTSSTNTKPLTLSFAGGVDNDESTIPFADTARAYDLFASAEEVDISLLLSGSSRDGGTNGEQQANYLIDNIAEVRKDCVVFVSPQRADVVNQTTAAAQNIVDFRNSVRSSSFAVMDSGYKYMYDKYNDVNRYVPLNGDIAGLCVVTDNSRDPWYSPAGTSRGQIRNSIKLAFNPAKAERDLLYKNGINPVISSPGEGTILFGDKTLLAKPSAFDRINVRRLFIVLEKSIARAAKSLMFEFNDEFTRTQFRNLVEPFLRDVQGRRGITDFKVVCDATNNTAEVIDSNRFVGDIYVKPARSINFIQLNFVAVRSGIEFSEIVG